MIDNQIITTPLEGKRRIIYQYREKRAALDKHNIEKQIEKDEKIIGGKITLRKTKFWSIKTKDKKLNRTLIDKAKALAGIKGCVTNMDTSDAQVISAYHQLWQVEKSFRMSKSDLKARPTFLHKRDSIEAHLTIVLAALAVSKIVENKTGISIKRFVNTMRPIRSGVVSINGYEYEAEAEIPLEVQPLIRKLETTH